MSTTHIHLETKPDFRDCVDRINAWFEQRIIDRPPVRFHRHNAEFEVVDETAGSWSSLRDRWFDARYCS